MHNSNQERMRSHTLSRFGSLFPACGTFSRYALATAAAQISLIKLGNELHGPTDEMRITRSHILFIEDLKNDSAVVLAIKTFRGEK